MLILAIEKGKRLVIRQGEKKLAVVGISRIQGNRVRLEIAAPDRIRIDRQQENEPREPWEIPNACRKGQR